MRKGAEMARNVTYQWRPALSGSPVSQFGIETRPGIPLKASSISDVSAWGDRSLPAADFLLDKSPHGWACAQVVAALHAFLGSTGPVSGQYSALSATSASDLQTS
jgi:hypothetical protein